MAEHSPGPFRIDYGMFETGIAIVRENDPNIVVAEVWPQTNALPMGEDAVAVANAKLFVAAPRLLASVKRFLSAETLEHRLLAMADMEEVVTQATD